VIEQKKKKKKKKKVGGTVGQVGSTVGGKVGVKKKKRLHSSSGLAARALVPEAKPQVPMWAVAAICVGGLALGAVVYSLRGSGGGGTETGSQSAAQINAALKDPSQAKEKAPDTFKVKFDTTKGTFSVECHRDWAPNGVDRFYNLVKLGYYEDIAFFRVVKSPKPFMVQFGIHGTPELAKIWSEQNIEPDAVKQSNTRGMLTYAQAGRPKEKGMTADARSTQLFINYGDNSSLDGQGFAPICQVLGNGMEVVDQLEGQYGEKTTSQQGQIVAQGNEFLRKAYPALDYLKRATIE
jgi:cyclophilin family peptidyl-prolyl cis-trans isomerase